MSGDEWLSTEDVARSIGGVTPRWVRKQIECGRLRARVLLTGERVTFRISCADLADFVSRFVIDDSRDRGL